MRVVVLGAGTVGTWIADLLCRNRHSVTVVDSDAANAKRINTELDVRVVTGSASASSVLFQADVIGADLCISVTGNDEINLDEFVAQSDAYMDTQGMASFYKVTAMLRRTHPFIMSRVAELRTWVTDGDYHTIVGGEYVRRGEENSVATDVRKAGAYYSEAATTVFEDTENKLIRTLQGFADRIDGAVDSFDRS